jgi:hypothetical protein
MELAYVSLAGLLLLGVHSSPEWGCWYSWS